jgi:hypothetical protein
MDVVAVDVPGHLVRMSERRGVSVGMAHDSADRARREAAVSSAFVGAQGARCGRRMRCCVCQHSERTERK